MGTSKNEGSGKAMTKKSDGAKDLYAYVTAVRRQGATLLPIEPPRSAKDGTKRKRAIKASVKKAQN